MKPELVLDEDEKKTRFRKFLSKKAIKEEPLTEEPHLVTLKVEANITDETSHAENMANKYIAEFQDEHKMNMQYFCEQRTVKREDLYSGVMDRSAGPVIPPLPPQPQPLTQITAEDVDQHFGLSHSSYQIAGNMVRTDLTNNGVSVIERMPRQGDIWTQYPYKQTSQNRKSVIVRARKE